ncbi:hypothetical protein PC113_g17799 [Phytophthora cactorum]|uniref:Uncharacterized protein n=1 Tax=Phytophthora cactorum TaxID=29920 RepID=A0A8T0YL93_9STRA|nr:hypothetical protein PC113_g17799 [Phytophthora cactorum]
MKAASLTHSSSESCLPSLTRHFSIKRTRLAASQFHDETLGIPLSWLSIPVELKRYRSCFQQGTHVRSQNR